MLKQVQHDNTFWTAPFLYLFPINIKVAIIATYEEKSPLGTFYTLFVYTNNFRTLS